MSAHLLMDFQDEEIPSTGLFMVVGATRVINDRTIFDQISFELNSGERLFIMGPSGAGKSLLLRSIAGLDQMQAGSLFLNGKSPDHLGMPTWRSHVMYVTQSRVNFTGTPEQLLEEVLKFGSRKGRPHGDMRALASQMGLPSECVKQQWSELSGGQAQRMSIAMALALQPDVLLLDEPTSACDPESVRLVESVLKGCGSALVWVTHEAQQAQRVGGHVLMIPSGQLVRADADVV